MWALRYTGLIYGFLGRGDLCVSTGSFNVSVFVAAAETPLPRILQQMHVLSIAASVTQLENHNGGTSISIPVRSECKMSTILCQLMYFESVSLSRNVLFFYGPEYGFFSPVRTSGFWVV